MGRLLSYIVETRDCVFETYFSKESSLMPCRRTVKNIPKYAPAQFYIDNVLPRIKEKKIMALKPFVDRLGYVANP